MEDNKLEVLYIPSGLKTRTELVEGYGRDEVMATIMVTLLGGVVAFFIYLFTKSTATCIVFMLIIMAGSVMLLTKDSVMNLSVADHIKNMVGFWLKQKVFKYRYIDEWFIALRKAKQ